MDKKDFLTKDRIIKGITDDGFFKVTVVKTTDVVKLAKEKHKLGLLATVVLGRALTGTMLLAAHLKGEERMRLTLQGNGPLELMQAEANSVGEIRGFVKNPQAELDYSKNQQISDGIGIGLLTVTKTLYNEAEPTSGTVELVNGNVSADISHYLMQSEQIQSAIHLDVAIGNDGEITAAGGVLIQALPGAPTDKIDIIQKNLTSMPQITDAFLSGDYIDDILEEVVQPYKIKELDRYMVHFFCRCNKDRFKNALRLLNNEDLVEISDTGQELVCQFCNEAYHINKEEIEAIMAENKARMN